MSLLDCKCDECGSLFFSSVSSMSSLCPECAHVLYGRNPCDHEFYDGHCTKCGWDNSVSKHCMVKSLGTLQKLDEKQIQLLWYFDWWDGPLNGLAEYSGQKSWFAYHGMDDPAGHYYYKLYLLSKEQVDEATRWNENESKYDLDWKSPILPNQQPIGWFSDGANVSFYGVQVTWDDDSAQP